MKLLRPMELRAFAQSILFATSLEEKLRRPPPLTDERPGPALAAPAQPGRPAELRFKERRAAGGEFPGTHALETEAGRGRLLHFFANHELLATELMALVLLRFPEAPAAFRRGVLATLRDEQEHTRLYLERMRACGIAFGELPVSGYIWRAVSGMESPIDYVAGLCLTFEQANLDFARQFARQFAAVGDTASAQLLERIHRDEIGHVALGLKWFRRWKNPGEEDWTAFCRQLKFPLSPQRAKGPALNVAGRRAAGLDAKFIAELDVFSQSKGRTPGVFVFNPFAEGRIARGTSFTPGKHQQLLARDLESLPQFLARPDDVVLVTRRPAVEFLSGLKRTGFALPEFVERDNIESLTGRKLARLRPWAWGPDSVELLGPLFASVTDEHRAPGECFNERIARLYSKAWSAEFLRNVLVQEVTERRGENTAPDLCGVEDVGVAVDTLDAALDAIAAVRARGHLRVVAKEAIGLAGGNALRLWERELTAAQRRWLEGVTARGGEVVIEPWHERVGDFSSQLEMEPRGLRLVGFTGLINDHRGQFQANWAAPSHARRIPAALTSLLGSPAGVVASVHALYENIFARLEDELRAVNFLGPLGIDAFIYRTATGETRLKPVVEINPRYTMGRLTLELMRHACPGSHGTFRLVSRAEAQGNFPAFAQSLAQSAPLQLEGEPVPRIRAGAVCLNDPGTAEVCLAVFEVQRAPRLVSHREMKP